MSLIKGIQIIQLIISAHLLLIFFTIPLFVFSHPSWGIVAKQNGDIYFVDVMHKGIGTLWKINSENDIIKVLTDFHAHDFQLDRP